MKKNIKFFIVFGIILFHTLLNCAQDVDNIAHNDTTVINPKAIKGFVAISSHFTTNQQVPLWMRSMKHGSIPQSGMSASASAGIYKNYNHLHKDRLLDWGAGINTQGNIGNEQNLYLIEAYAKARIGIFQLVAGRTKDITGLVDSSFSTGSFSISGNALGIPKVEISVPDYWEIPYTNKLFALKSTFSHGWMGDRMCSDNYSQYTENKEFGTYFHQKTLYGRFGKPFWKIRLYGGFNHQVMWGNEQKMYADFGLSEWKTFGYMFTGKAYGNDVVPSSKVGNHIGSLDQGLEINLKQIQLFGYHQFYYEAGALAKLANVKDGTWGLSIKNIDKTDSRFTWHKFLFEFVHSKSQGGELDAVDRPSGTEDYYNNTQYIDGWTNKGENIGNILFTSKKYIRESLPQPIEEYIVNNRVTAIHTALDFSVNKWQFVTMVTLSKNYGNYDNTPIHRDRGGNIYYGTPPFFEQVNQLNGYIKASRSLKRGWALNMAFAKDHGSLLYHSDGGYLEIIKKF